MLQGTFMDIIEQVCVGLKVRGVSSSIFTPPCSIITIYSPCIIRSFIITVLSMTVYSREVYKIKILHAALIKTTLYNFI